MRKLFQAAQPVITIERRLELKGRAGLRNEPGLPWDTELFLETRPNYAHGAELINQAVYLFTGFGGPLHPIISVVTVSGWRRIIYYTPTCKRGIFLERKLAFAANKLAT